MGYAMPFLSVRTFPIIGYQLSPAFAYYSTTTYYLLRDRELEFGIGISSKKLKFISIWIWKKFQRFEEEKIGISLEF